MQAIVAAAIIVAFADGDYEASEAEALQEILASQDSLQVFNSNGELQRTIDTYVGKMKASKVLGRTQLLREIQDVASVRSDAEEVFAVAASIAMADGELEPAELDRLKQIGKILGLRPEDFLDAA